ncbi:MAG: hypothetical protein AAFQ68_16720 [Bacteroidota bacterium]
MSPLELEKHRIERYEAFRDRYEVEDFERLVALYEIDDLESFLPPSPSDYEKKIFNQLVGTLGVEGYMDYRKSNHTFELIMQWQELTNNLDLNAFQPDSGKA